MRRLGGKSVIIAEIIKLATNNHNNVLFLVHRKELIAQIHRTLVMADVDFGYVELYMVQTATRRIAKLKPPTMIVVDECHRVLANSYKRIIDTFHNAVVVGFTATPQRMNEGGLGDVFDALVDGVSTQWLIDNHFLAPFKAYSVPLADTSNLHIKRGDYDPVEVDELMNNNIIFGDTVTNWRKFANGKQTIVYCASIVTSMATAQAFKNAGINAAHIDGTTSAKERDAIVQDFRDAKITVLCNVDLFGEGFDVPDCECVVMLRPTQSLTVHIQQSMRSMRYKEGKTALILDHVGNLYRHGLPTETHRWTLETKRKKEKSTIHVKQCPACMAVVTNTTKTCPYCGFDFTPSEQEQEQIRKEGLLEEYKARPASRYTDITTFDGLMLFAKAKGYHFFWCVYKAIELGIKVPPKYRWAERRILRKLNE